MNKFRPATALLSLLMILALFSGCGPQTAATPTPAPTPVQTPAATPTPAARPTVRLAVLKGPTGMGAAKLLADSDAGVTAIEYDAVIAAAPDELVGKLIAGELDIAALPTNFAAALFNKTDGDIQILALNTLGVLYILENGNTVKSVADLKGKTIYATGQGANPEFVLNFLLRQNGLEAGRDVAIEWKPGDEVAAKMAGGEISLCMLPVPASTGVLMKNKDVRSALDLTSAWNAAANGSLTMGCVVARRDFVEKHGALVDAFLSEYEASISFVKESAQEAAALIAQYEITPSAAIAAAALPQANLTFVSGAAVREAIEEYYRVLFEADKTSIGGFIPDDSFYYIP